MNLHRHPNCGVTREFLKGFDGGFDRYIIGYNYNPGGYQEWPKVKRVYYLKAVKRMKKQGWIKESKRQGKVFLKLTKKGKIRTLLYKLKDLKAPSPRAWDGKWRMILFDIPENCKCERNHIRRMLKQVGFYQFQKSAYIYPYQVPVDVVDFFKESGLIRFVHLMEVSYLSEDHNLRKYFKLKKK